MSRSTLRRSIAVIAATVAGLGVQTALAGGPTVDMSPTKTHVGTSFTRGAQGQYTITVHNGGPGTLAAGTGDGTQITDTLPSSLTFVSGTGTGWSCGAVGQVVTCSITASAPSVASGADYPTITLTVAVSASAPATISNTATVSVGGTSFATDPNPTNNSSTDVVDVVGAAATPTATPTATAAPTSIAAPATGSADPGDSKGSWTPIILMTGLLLVVTALAWRRRSV